MAIGNIEQCCKVEKFKRVCDTIGTSIISKQSRLADRLQRGWQMCVMGIMK